MVVMLSDGYGPVKAASSPPHPPPPKQDKWAAEIAKAVQRKGGDSQGADAVEQEIRQEEKRLAAKYRNDPGEKDTLAAAGVLAFTRFMAQQAAQKVKDPTQLQQLSMQLMSQNLVAVAGNAQVTSADRARIERLLLDSDDTKKLGAGVAFLGQSLQVVDASHLPAADKAALKHTILGSDYANSLGPGTAKFLHDFLGALAKAQHDPKDTEAVVTATFDMYMVRTADQPQQASGAALDNELGQDLGLQPDRLQPCTAANPQGLANGKFELYSGKQLDALRQIAQQIHSVGGSNAKVTVLPVIFAPQGKDQLQQHVLCRVTGANGKTSYVSDEGRTYKNVRDFMDHNKLPFGKLYVAHDGHLSIDGNGQVQIDTHQKSKGVWDYTKEVGNGLAIVGLVVLTVAAVIASDGALAPVLGYAWAAYGASGAAQGGSDLYDRSQHGQSVGLNRQTAGDYVNIASVLLGPLGRAGQGMKTAAAAARATGTVADSADAASGAGRTLGNRALSAGGRTLTGGATVVNFGAPAYSTQDLIRNWNNLSVSDKIQGVLNTGMAVAGTAAHGARTITDRRTAAATPNETVPAAAVTPDRNGLPIARSNGDDGDPAPLAATDGTARSGQAADEGGRPTGTARPDAVVPPGRSPVDGAAGTPARDIPVAEATSPRAPAALPASSAGSPPTSSLTSPLTMEGAAAQERASQHDDAQRHNAESKHAQAEAGIRAADVRHGTARTVRLPPSGRTGTGRTDSARPGDGRPGTGRAGTGPGRVAPSGRNPPGSEEVMAGITTAPKTGPAAAAADGPTPAHPVPGETSQAQEPAGRSGSDSTPEAGELQPPATTAPMASEVVAQAGRRGDQPPGSTPASGAAGPVEPAPVGTTPERHAPASAPTERFWQGKLSHLTIGDTIIDQAVANLPGELQVRVDLVDVLAAFKRPEEIPFIEGLVRNLAHGGDKAASAVDLLERIGGQRKGGMHFELAELVAAHQRGDAILTHGPLQEPEYLENEKWGDASVGRYKIVNGRLTFPDHPTAQTGSRLPSHLQKLDFVLLEGPGGQKRLILGFNHSGLSGGRPSVLGAGEFTLNRDGEIIAVNRMSGHYRPSPDNLERVRDFLFSQGIITSRGAAIEDIP